MSPVGTAIDGFHIARELLETAGRHLSEGHLTPEVVSARDLAETQLEAQTSILKEAIAAQTVILDILA